MKRAELRIQNGRDAGSLHFRTEGALTTKARSSQRGHQEKLFFWRDSIAEPRKTNVKAPKSFQLPKLSGQIPNGSSLLFGEKLMWDLVRKLELRGFFAK